MGTENVVATRTRCWLVEQKYYILVQELMPFCGEGVNPLSLSDEEIEDLEVMYEYEVYKVFDGTRECRYAISMGGLYRGEPKAHGYRDTGLLAYARYGAELSGINHFDRLYNPYQATRAKQFQLVGNSTLYKDFATLYNDTASGRAGHRVIGSQIMKRLKECGEIPRDDILIRDTNYNPKFLIPNGGTFATRKTIYSPQVVGRAVYHDDYHFTYAGYCYHVDQFSEVIRCNGNIIEPENEALTEEHGPRIFEWKLNNSNDSALVMQLDTRNGVARWNLYIDGTERDTGEIPMYGNGSGTLNEMRDKVLEQNRMKSALREKKY